MDFWGRVRQICVVAGIGILHMMSAEIIPGCVCFALEWLIGAFKSERILLRMILKAVS